MQWHTCWLFMSLIKYEIVMEMKKWHLKWNESAVNSSDDKYAKFSLYFVVAFLNVIINLAFNCHANHYIGNCIRYVHPHFMAIICFTTRVICICICMDSFVHLQFAATLSIRSLSFPFSCMFRCLLKEHDYTKNKTLSFHECYDVCTHAEPLVVMQMRANKIKLFVLFMPFPSLLRLLSMRYICIVLSICSINLFPENKILTHSHFTLFCRVCFTPFKRMWRNSQKLFCFF